MLGSGLWQARATVSGCAEPPRSCRWMCSLARPPSLFLGAPGLPRTRRRAELRSLLRQNNMPRTPGWLARARASHGSIMPLLVSLFCGERSVFDGPASRRRPRSGALRDASDR